MFILKLFWGVKDKEWRLQFVNLHLNVSEIIGLERLMSIQLMAGKNLIRPHRKCAFHLLFLQVASVWFVIDTSSLAVNTWGLNHHFLSVKLFPLFCGNIIVN